MHSFHVKSAEDYKTEPSRQDRTLKVAAEPQLAVAKANLSPLSYPFPVVAKSTFMLHLLRNRLFKPHN